MCIKLSDSWLRKKFENVPEELYQGNPSRLLRPNRSGPGCGARAEFSQTASQKNQKSQRLAIIKSGLEAESFDENTGEVLFWRYCEDLSNISCGTKIIQNATTITYKNQLTFDLIEQFPSQIKQNKLISSSDPIMDYPFIAIPFQCHYSSDYQVGNNFIVAEEKTVEQFTGIGTFQVSVKLYNDDKFDSPLAGNGLSVKDRLYGGAEIEDKATHGSDIVLVLKSIWMTQSEDPNDGTFYPLVVQGCSVNQEQHDFQYHTLNDTESNQPSEGTDTAETHSHAVYFSMKGIQFTPKTSLKPSDPIYASSFIHAMVKVCNQDDEDCFRNCDMSDEDGPNSRTIKTIKSALEIVPETQVHGDRVLVGPPRGLDRGSTSKRFGGQEAPVFGFVQLFMTETQKGLVGGSKRRRRSIRWRDMKYRHKRATDSESDKLNEMTPISSSGSLNVYELVRTFEPEIPDYESSDEDGEHSTRTTRYGNEPVRYYDQNSGKISTLGPIYWKNDIEIYDEFREIAEDLMVMNEEEKKNNQLIVILSIVVIVASIGLIAIVMLYYFKWSKKREENGRVQAQIERVDKANVYTIDALNMP